MSVKVRQYIERKIVRRLVEDLVAAGYTVARADCCGSRHMELEDCDECSDSPCVPSDPSNVDAVLAAMFQGDDDRLWIAKDGKLTGEWVWLIYGNSGDDVISDYSVGLDSIVEPIYAWVENGFEARS